MSCIDQNLSNLDLKLLTDSTDTALSGKLFRIGTILSVEGQHVTSEVYFSPSFES